MSFVFWGVGRQKSEISQNQELSEKVTSKLSELFFLFQNMDIALRSCDTCLPKFCTIQKVLAACSWACVETGGVSVHKQSSGGVRIQAELVSSEVSIRQSTAIPRVSGPVVTFRTGVWNVTGSMSTVLRLCASSPPLQANAGTVFTLKYAITPS
jgi:hypothetical protein